MLSFVKFKRFKTDAINAEKPNSPLAYIWVVYNATIIKCIHEVITQPGQTNVVKQVVTALLQPLMK